MQLVARGFLFFELLMAIAMVGQDAALELPDLGGGVGRAGCLEGLGLVQGALPLKLGGVVLRVEIGDLFIERVLGSLGLIGLGFKLLSELNLTMARLAQ